MTVFAPSVIPDPRMKTSGAGIFSREVFANGKCSEGPSFFFFALIKDKKTAGWIPDY